MRGGVANAFAPFLGRFRLPLFEVAFSPKERVFSWRFAPPVFARFARFSGCGRFLPPVFGGGEARFQARSAWLRGGVPDCQAEGGKFRLYTQKNRASGNSLASLPKSQGSRWQAGGGSGAAAENSGGAVFCRLKPALRRASLLEVSALSASKFRRFSRGSLQAAFSLPL